MLVYTQMKDKLFRLSKGSEGGFVICISNSDLSGGRGWNRSPRVQAPARCPQRSRSKSDVSAPKFQRPFRWEFWEHQPEILLQKRRRCWSSSFRSASSFFWVSRHQQLLGMRLASAFFPLCAGSNVSLMQQLLPYFPSGWKHNGLHLSHRG